MRRVLPGFPESSSLLHMSKPDRNADGLTRLYTYEHLRSTYGWGRRPIENAVRAGKLRRPMMTGKRAAWTGNDIDDYLARLRGEREALALDSPADVPEDKIADALQQLSARFAAINGQPVAPEEVVGFTYKLTDEQRAAIAHNADAKQREMIEGILAQLDGLHFVEALMLQRAFLPPLRRFADEGLKQLGIEINMSDAEWREAAMLIVDRVINGETLPADTHPREVVEVLAEDGVLSRKAL